jgi:LacI family transcriptional regulator
VSTLAEVAQRANVSLATASRVISNSPRGVTEELRARVLEAARELDYVPNAHAQALVLSKTHTIGVIGPDVSDPYFSEVVRGIQTVAGRVGRLVTICNSYRDPKRELAYFRLLRAQMVEAIILASSGLQDQGHNDTMSGQIEAFESSGGRVSLIGRHLVPGDNVVPDNFSGARDLGRALLELGHRCFGIVGGPPHLTSSIDRLQGFRSALQEADIALPPENIANGDFSRDGGLQATFELLDRLPEITAIFALNDQMATGVLAALRERGVAVPEEMSVAGFNDFPIARDLTPALSTVRLPLIEMGVRAAELALQPRSGELVFEHLPAEVILRESTAEARS